MELLQLKSEAEQKYNEVNEQVSVDNSMLSMHVCFLMYKVMTCIGCNQILLLHSTRMYYEFVPFFLGL